MHCLGHFANSGSACKGQQMSCPGHGLAFSLLDGCNSKHSASESFFDPSLTELVYKVLDGHHALCIPSPGVEWAGREEPGLCSEPATDKTPLFTTFTPSPKLATSYFSPLPLLQGE